LLQLERKNLFRFSLEDILFMANSDIRWQQRFKNFETALINLQESVAQKKHSDLEKAGVIQYYEFTFELAWKTLKDYLEEREVLAQYPRDVIKESFKYNLVRDGDIWLDMLQKRNLMSHTYNKKNAQLAFSLIVDSYLAELKDVYEILKKEE